MGASPQFTTKRWAGCAMRDMGLGSLPTALCVLSPVSSPSGWLWGGNKHFIPGCCCRIFGITAHSLLLWHRSPSSEPCLGAAWCQQLAGTRWMPPEVPAVPLGAVSLSGGADTTPVWPCRWLCPLPAPAALPGAPTAPAAGSGARPGPSSSSPAPSPSAPGAAPSGNLPGKGRDSRCGAETESAPCPVPTRAPLSNVKGAFCSSSSSSLLQEPPPADSSVVFSWTGWESSCRRLGRAASTRSLWGK